MVGKINSFRFIWGKTQKNITTYPVYFVSATSKVFWLDVSLIECHIALHTYHVTKLAYRIVTVLKNWHFSYRTPKL